MYGLLTVTLRQLAICICAVALSPVNNYIRGNQFALWAYNLLLCSEHAPGGLYAITIPLSSCCNWSQLLGPNIH